MLVTLDWQLDLDYLINNIAFDRDIKGIYIILKHFLKYDKDKALKNWLKVLNKYPIRNLEKDLNFSLLLYDFPILLIKEIGLNKFLEIKLTLNKDINFLLDNNLFNIFMENTGIYKIINSYILDSKDKVYGLIKDVYLNQKSFPQDIFDYNIFISNIIKIYLNNNIIDIDLFKNIIKTVKNKKERILINTLLIDYL